MIGHRAKNACLVKDLQCGQFSPGQKPSRSVTARIPRKTTTCFHAITLTRSSVLRSVLPWPRLRVSRLDPKRGIPINNTHGVIVSPPAKIWCHGYGRGTRVYCSSARYRLKRSPPTREHVTVARTISVIVSPLPVSFIRVESRSQGTDEWWSPTGEQQEVGGQSTGPSCIRVALRCPPSLCCKPWPSPESKVRARAMKEETAYFSGTYARTRRPRERKELRRGNENVAARRGSGRHPYRNIPGIITMRNDSSGDNGYGVHPLAHHE